MDPRFAGMTGRGDEDFRELSKRVNTYRNDGLRNVFLREGDAVRVRLFRLPAWRWTVVITA